MGLLSLSLTVCFFFVFPFHCNGEYIDAAAEAALKGLIGKNNVIGGTTINIPKFKKTGSGEFSFIMMAKLNNTIDVAIKFEPDSQPKKYLSQEYDMYNALKATAKDSSSEVHGILRVFHFGSFLNTALHMLVINPLDNSIFDMFKKFHGQFTRETILLTFLQSMETLEYMHELEILHRDISPRNFLVRNRDSKLFVADLGFAIRNGVKQSSTAGSLLFCSPDSLTPGYQQTKTDDLYSEICVMMFLCGPWFEEILRDIRKEPVSPQKFLYILDELDYDLPELFKYFYTELQSCKNEKREFKYNEMISRLRAALQKGKDPNQQIFFQWISENGHTPIANENVKNRMSGFIKNLNKLFRSNKNLKNLKK